MKLCSSARDQLALGHDDAGRYVRALEEELGGRKHQHPVLLGDEQEPVFGEAHPVGNGELDRRREGFDLVGHAVVIAIGDGPDVGLAGADERHRSLRRDRHVPGVGDDRVERDFESRWQLDPIQVRS